MRSSRHWVRTWMVTPSGMRSSSISSRTKSKSVCDAAGKPTSISVKPISTRRSHMRRLRTESIGSTSAWLPSRRSTEHQIGADSSRLSGQVRSEVPRPDRAGTSRRAWCPHVAVRRSQQVRSGCQTMPGSWVAPRESVRWKVYGKQETLRATRARRVRRAPVCGARLHEKKQGVAAALHGLHGNPFGGIVNQQRQSAASTGGGERHGLRSRS